MADPKLELLTAQNSLLLLVDYQPAMFKGVGSSDRNAIRNSALAAAKAAQILKVPTVLTSIWPEGNGEFSKDITDLFLGQEVIVRKMPGFDAFEDERVLQAVKKTGRKKLVVSGLWTSMCFAYTAIHALREGFDVYGLIDAGGDASLDAHNYGVQRMVQVGVVPITWMPPRSCPCRSSTGGRRPKARALPPTSPNRTRVSPATIARERISAPRSTTRSRAIACWTRSRRPRQPVSVKRLPGGIVRTMCYRMFFAPLPTVAERLHHEAGVEYQRTPNTGMQPTRPRGY